MEWFVLEKKKTYSSAVLNSTLVGNGIMTATADVERGADHSTSVFLDLLQNWGNLFGMSAEFGSQRIGSMPILY